MPNVIEVLRQYTNLPEKFHRYVRSDGKERVVSFPELWQEVCSRANQLAKFGLRPGQSVALVLGQPDDYVLTFLGALAAGVVPVAIAPPVVGRTAYKARVQQITRTARATVLVGDSGALLPLKEVAASSGLRLLHVRELQASAGAADTTPPVSDPRPDDVAFLQFTSGSTHEPKGVTITHRNLAANVRQIIEGLDIVQEDRPVSWLPPFHDMGLIGFVFVPLFAENSAVYLATDRFVTRPSRWFDEIHRHRGTITFAPNVGYELMTRSATEQQIAQWDLSCVRVMGCGAERIRADVMRSFIERFGRSGLRPNVVAPCYGLAEATLAVTCAKPGRPLLVNALVAPGDNGSSTELVSCGAACRDVEVQIADPYGAAVPDGIVGEVRVRGPNVTPGYFENPEATARAFDRDWLLTGDLGYLERGQLFVCGRVKELIILHGRNYYPTDIEHSIEKYCHECWSIGACIAFSVELESGSRLVVAAEVPGAPSSDSHSQVAAHVRAVVAEHHELEVGSVVLVVPGKLPRTTSGKLQRSSFRAAYMSGAVEGQLYEDSRFAPEAAEAAVEKAALPPSDPCTHEPATARLRVWMVDALAGLLQVPAASLDPRRSFFELGADSLKAVRFVAALSEYVGREISPTLLWDYPSIEQLSRYVAVPGHGDSPAHTPASPDEQEAIAVIGMACRFPGAPDLESFWQILHEGRDATTEVPAERWDIDAFYDPRPGVAGKMYARKGGFISDVDKFDHEFFGLAPREAVSMDPQQRLVLELASEALEHAGQTARQLNGSRSGVFVGVSSNDHALRLAGSAKFEHVDGYAVTGNSASVVAGRLSYTLGLEGPCVALDTACSSSLVALHHAVTALRRGECDLAIVAGVHLMLSPLATIGLCQLRALALDGRCKAFDAAADGYVRGEGGGVVVLKRFSAAKRDDDPVRALIRGTAINQDGATNGLTAPKGAAQEKVIRAALRAGGLDGSALDYVEAHGTGTPLGDPIELQALTAATASGRSSERPLIVGSVKTNIGHLEAAAGMASLVKVVLMLQRRWIPASLHCQQLNPNVPWSGLPLQVATRAMEWPRANGNAALAGVSSFGFSGTNAHAILEAYAPVAEGSGDDSDRRDHLVTLSARSDAALRVLATRYLAAIEAGGGLELPDIAYTSSVRRNHHDVRLSCAADSVQALRERLSQYLDGKHTPAVASGQAPLARPQPPVFVFSGQGSEWSGMGRSLLTEPIFAAAIDECDRVVERHAGWSIRRVLEQAQTTLDNAVLQPVLLALQVGLSALLQDWGIAPGAVIGHSLGEIGAAHVAGALSLPDALRLTLARGRLMQRTAGQGRMLAIQAPLAELQHLLGALSVAAVNSPNSTVVAGDAAALEELVQRLNGLHRHEFLKVDHAFHSAQLDPHAEQLAQELSWLEPGAPRLAMASTVSGQLLGADDKLDAEHWARNMRRPVLFESAVRALVAAGHREFIELGPHPVLALPLQQCLQHQAEAARIQHTLRRGRSERGALLRTLGELYVRGHAVNWERVSGRRACVALPTYPFQRERHWLPDLLDQDRSLRVPARGPEQDWLYRVQWQPSPRQTTRDPRTEPRRWVILCDGSQLGQELLAELSKRGQPATRIEPSEDAVRQLQRVLDETRTAVGVVRICEPLSGEAESLEATALHDQASSRVAHLLSVVQSLVPAGAQSSKLWLVTRAAQPLGEADPVELGQACEWGIGQVVRSEHPELWGGLIDVSATFDPRELGALTNELLHPDDIEDQLLLRAGDRYVRRLLRDRAPATEHDWNAEATYLITGGLGAFGLSLAERLVARGARHLVLVGRRANVSDDTLERLSRMQDVGAKVHCEQADAACETDMAALLARIDASGSPLRGVFHAAGSMDIQSLVQASPEAVAQQLSAKVRGGWVLHRLTRERALDVFVCFSSAAATWGSRGLGMYAAANQFLDSLAAHRRSLGLAATSIAWGPCQGGLNDREIEHALAQMGLRSLPMSLASQLIGSIVTSGQSHRLVADVDWPAFLAVYQARGARGLMSALAHESAGERHATPGESHFVERLERAVSHARLPLTQKLIRETVAGVMQTPAERLHLERGFFEQGMDSLMAVEAAKLLTGELGRVIHASDMFQYANVSALSEHVLRDLLGLAEDRANAVAQPVVSARREPIAVIGASCRLPGGVTSMGDLWTLLCNGTDAITEVPPTRWDLSRYWDPDPAAPDKMNSRWGGFLEDIDRFDARFFDIAPREAAAMDPQQRLILEVAWEALETAGMPKHRTRDRRGGVFIGISGNDYMQTREPAPHDAHQAMGNAVSVTAGRVSYLLGLRGPSMCVDTACSSSLTALHLACRSIESGESQFCLAGGVNLTLSPRSSICLSKAGMLSLEGRCKTFSDRADGYVRSEGCGVVVLKRLSDALHDRDPILAVIRGTAVNQDGASSALTVPNPTAQIEVIQSALQAAGLHGSDVDYVEAHGTGTALGDPIELQALAAAVAGRSPERPLLVGTIKSNIGHLESASGVAGLLKVVLMLQRGRVPASLHCERLNPRVPWNELPLRVAVEDTSWPERPGGRPAIAGVSSFGFSGTNAHAVLESFAADSGTLRPEAAGGEHAVLLSARSSAALEEMTRNLVRTLECEPSSRTLEDIAYTTCLRRGHHEHRLVCLAESVEMLREQLSEHVAGRRPAGVITGRVAPEGVGAPVFVFSGQGSEWAGMGSALLQEPAFLAALQACDEIVRADAGWSIISVLRDRQAQQLRDNGMLQPTLLAVELGLNALLQSWGITPGAVIGHSLGEIAAAHVAGILSMPDALRLAVARGRVMQQSAGLGKMMAIRAPLDALQPWLQSLSVAAVNSPLSTVVAGDISALAQLEERLRGVHRYQYLEVDHPFHSALLEPYCQELKRELSWLQPSQPRLSMASTVSGQLLQADSRLDAEHWARNMRQPVQFEQAVRALYAAGHRVFLEVGPHPVLKVALTECLRDCAEATHVHSTLRKNRDERGLLLRTAAELYSQGHSVDWEPLMGHGRCVPLPTYPFQRERHWLADASELGTRTQSTERSPTEWLYSAQWQLASQAEAGAEPIQRWHWVVLCDGSQLGRELATDLARQEHACTRIVAGDSASEQLRRVFVETDASVPIGVVLVCEPLGSDPELLDAAELHARVSVRLAGLLDVVRCMLARGSRPAKLWLLTRAAQRLSDEERVELGLAGHFGLGQAIRSEHPELWGGVIDLSRGFDRRELAALTHELLTTRGDEDQLAFRGGGRYVRRLVRQRHRSSARSWDEGATYLITGGLGAFGLSVAETLVEQGVRHVVLVGRGKSIPAEVLSRVERLREAASSVHLEQADVCDEDQMAGVLARIDASAHPLRGVFHAAGVVRVELLPQVSPESLAQQLAAKVLGSWVLHRLTRERALDVFVCFSSTAGTWGAQGLGVYAAANAFLDSLARHRRSLGLSATSIAWGPCKGGMNSAELETALERMGLRSMPMPSASRLVANVAFAAVEHQVVADVEWERFVPFWGTATRLFDQLAESLHRRDANGKTAFTRALERAARERRLPLLQELVLTEIAAVMQLDDPEDLELARGFFDQGMNSIMAVELAQRLSNVLGHSVSTPVVFEWPTVRALSSYIFTELLDGSARDTNAEVPSAQTVGTEDAAISASIEQLSESELEARLLRELEELDL